jgi:pilus assembly protein Flp/PilA
MISIRRILKQEDGATAIEYALLASMIALVIIASVRLIGTNLTGIFTNVSAGFN